jgi:hypothetical protein
MPPLKPKRRPEPPTESVKATLPERDEPLPEPAAETDDAVAAIMADIRALGGPDAPKATLQGIEQLLTRLAAARR